MIRLDFNAQGIFDQLDRARDRLTPVGMRPVYADIGEYMVEATRQRFRSGTAPGGSPWRQKQPSTLAAYLRRGDGARPDPLIGPSGRLGREIAALVSNGGVEIGSALEYSAVMQHGAKKGAFGTARNGALLPWGDIPARVWLGLSADDESNILDIVDEHIGQTSS